MMIAMKGKPLAMDIMVTEATLDGLGEGTLALEALWEQGKPVFIINFFRKKKCVKSIRRFESLLRAVRSFRRYVLLSDEVKMGFGV